jgi:hypothetical protein
LYIEHVQTGHEELLEHSKTHPYGAVERTVLLQLAEHANDEGGCFPGYTLLHEETYLSKGAISEAIGNLVELGLISIVEKGRRRSTTYLLNINPNPQAPVTALLKRPKPIEKPKPFNIEEEDEDDFDYYDNFPHEPVAHARVQPPRASVPTSVPPQARVPDTHVCRDCGDSFLGGFAYGQHRLSAHPVLRS